MEDKLKKLAVLLLDDEHGIHEEAYCALLDLMPESLALELNRVTKCQDGRFYLPEDHTLWKHAVPPREIELDDGGAIEHLGDGEFRRCDVHGNTEEVRRPEDEDWQEWADLFGLKKEED